MRCEKGFWSTLKEHDVFFFFSKIFGVLLECKLATYSTQIFNYCRGFSGLQLLVRNITSWQVASKNVFA